MTDRPIIFSAPMVRALLESRKTQTRRVLKPQPIARDVRFNGFFGVTTLASFTLCHDGGANETQGVKVPYAPGDRLYVREAHYLTDDGECEYAVFAADQGDVDEHLANMQTTMASHPSIDWSKHLRLRPSIHMPRWASRLTLTVTDVRVQRLQEISEADAKAEGVERLHGGYHDDDDVYLNYLRQSDGFGGSGAARASFRTLWNSLHGSDAWAANPWVVAVSFTVQRGNIDQIGGAA